MYVRDIIKNITPEIRKEMETIWFTSDLHQGHPKIVDICNRPVYIEYAGEKDIKNNRDYKYLLSKAHDEWLVKEIFNKWVQKKDTVFILGDLSLDKRAEAERFIDRLNGNKFLILGNHDNNIDTSTRFSQITGIKDFKFKRGQVQIEIALAHYPMASWNKKPHGAWHLYGHVHGI
jgi:calcineurin-like phosphoesterase family protein